MWAKFTTNYIQHHYLQMSLWVVSTEKDEVLLFAKTVMWCMLHPCKGQLDLCEQGLEKRFRKDGFERCVDHKLGKPYIRSRKVLACTTLPYTLSLTHTQPKWMCMYSYTIVHAHMCTGTHTDTHKHTHTLCTQAFICLRIHHLHVNV